MTSGSWIRRMFEEGLLLKKQFGNDKVFDLSIGNPVMEPPTAFNDELLRLSSSPLPDMHRYMENAGYADTREAVAAQLCSNTGLKFTTNSIVMTCGTSGAINIVLKTILNPGDEVITFAPYFFEYDSYIDNHGGVIKVVPSDATFTPRFDLLAASINAKTKAVIINSPNNPTGTVYSDDVLKQIALVILEKAGQYGTHIFIISDDVYCRVVYDGITCPRIIQHYSDTIIVTSFSKDLALPGERIGYAAVHPGCIECEEVVRGMNYAMRALGFVNAPALQQHLVGKLQNVTISMEGYQQKRDFLYSNLTKMGYTIIKPRGAFYMFPKTPIADDIAFIMELKQHMVLAVPGTSFKAPGYFRISYCTDDRTIEGCLDGFEKVAKYYKLRI